MPSHREPTLPEPRRPEPPSGVRAGRVLRNPRVWAVPAVLVGLLSLLMSLLYLGGILDPRADLHHLPIALVNTDRGAEVAGQRQNLGEQVVTGIAEAPGQGDAVSWRRLDEAAAREQLASGKLYGALQVPPEFTATVAALGGASAQPARPTVLQYTNPGVGSLGSSLAAQIGQQAVHQASLALGTRLTALPQAQGLDDAARLLIADPIALSTSVGHPIGNRSGLGLSAFYYTLLLVLAGFFGANIIGNGVDVALGYADNEVGPWRARHPVVPISRSSTLAVKCVMSVGLSLLTSSLIMLAGVVVLDMDAAHLPLLWVFSVCASSAVGLGVQAINAAFGGLGLLVSMFVFIVLGLPSSGATVPLDALPSFYRFLALFEPMRQLTDGVRAILFFDAQADAGLTRAWIWIGIGTVAALLFGFAMTRYYDRKGLHRTVPEHV
ncbi:YhgE/Pip domain-containing protein [Kitasatospora sp. NPDC008115]|uniref:YhgE/Pip domain-containing protein n=1 Tax=Kitasatospora sp. NPDC008115 TaxID=3364022 RepID=UPI0036EC7840